MTELKKRKSQDPNTVVHAVENFFHLNFGGCHKGGQGFLFCIPSETLLLHVVLSRSPLIGLAVRAGG